MLINCSLNLELKLVIQAKSKVFGAFYVKIELPKIPCI